MFVRLIVASLATLLGVTTAVQTTTERRVHRPKQAGTKAPVGSLSQLLKKSAELTKAFEKQAAEIREKVQESELTDGPAEDSADAAATSFLQVDSERPVVAGAGLKAMEAVTEEIMRYTDKMRKMGNEASMFSRR